MAVIKEKGRATCFIRTKINGRLMRFSGVRDRELTRRIEARIRKLDHAKTHGESIPTEVREWLKDLSARAPRLFDQLVEAGLVDASGSRRRALSDLLLGKIVKKRGFDDQQKLYARNGADDEHARRRVIAFHPNLYSWDGDDICYFQSKLADKSTREHVLQQVWRVDAVNQGCKFRSLDDLNGEKLKSWLKLQRETREDFGSTTSNHHIKAMRAFATWCLKVCKRHGEGNPFADVELLDTDDDIRRPRRAATADEINKLVSKTAKSEVVAGLTGNARAMLYRVALTMCLRARECWSLEPASFTKTDDGWSVRVAATYTKNKKEAVLPVPSSLSEVLVPWLKTRTAGKPLWPGKWYRTAAAMLQADLVTGRPKPANHGRVS